MPIYEFICKTCKRRFKKLVGMVAGPAPLACPACRSTDLSRQISRFARVRNEDDALDSLADEMESLGDSEDPKTIKRLMRDVGSAMDEDLGDDLEEMMEEEAGGSGPADETDLD